MAVIGRLGSAARDGVKALALVNGRSGTVMM